MIFSAFKKPKNIGKAALGLTAAGTLSLSVLVIPWETNKLTPYLDIAGIPTVCAGVTGPDVTAAYRAGKVYTPAECDKLNAIALKSHENGLRALIKDDIEAKIPDMTLAAFISWTYNVGVGAAKKSTLVRLINAGDFKGACNQLPRWSRVQGVVITGLANRRINGDKDRLSEYTLCMAGLDPNFQTPLLDKMLFNYQQWISQQTKDI